jgi:hypothetical protein
MNPYMASFSTNVDSQRFDITGNSALTLLLDKEIETELSSSATTGTPANNRSFINDGYGRVHEVRFEGFKGPNF